MLVFKNTVERQKGAILLSKKECFILSVFNAVSAESFCMSTPPAGVTGISPSTGPSAQRVIGLERNSLLSGFIY